MSLALPLLLLLTACGEDPLAGTVMEQGLPASAFHTLGEGRSWIYRDDDSDEDPDEEQLLRAQDVGEGRLELRRGSRWADAEPAGHIAWTTERGELWLSSWELPDGTEGAGGFRMADADPEDGELTSGDGGWRCDLTRQEDGQETWYGTFEGALIIDCVGGNDGLGGRYAFGVGAGLVYLETEDGYLLDLVAPW